MNIYKAAKQLISDPNNYNVQEYLEAEQVVLEYEAEVNVA